MPERMAALVFIFVAACGSEQPPLPQVRSRERITLPPTQEIRVLLTHEKAIEAIHSVQGAEHYTIRVVRIYQDWSESATADVEIAGEPLSAEMRRDGDQWIWHSASSRKWKERKSAR